MSNELAYWFAEGKNYQKGVAIYSKLIGESSRVRFFNSGSGKVHKNMLYNELLRYARIHKITPRKRPQKKVHKAQPQKQESKKHSIKKARVNVITNDIHYDDLPDHLQAKFDQNKELWSEILSLHVKMRVLKASPNLNEQRRKILNKILSIDKKRRDNWKDIDEAKFIEQKLEPTGKLSLDEINTIEDPAIRALSIERRVEANLMYIRRYKNKSTPRIQTQIALRISELKKLNVDYETRIRNYNDPE